MKLIVTVGLVIAGSLTLAAAGVLGSGEKGATGGWSDGGKPALVAGGKQAAAAGAAAAAKRGPVVTHLITRGAISVEPGENVFVELRCSKKQGVPIGGGFVLAAGSELVPAVQSRFNPNTLDKPKRAYFIGARNDSGSELASFQATLTCMKKVKERR